MSIAAPAATATAATAAGIKTFWATTSTPTSAMDVISAHAKAQQNDRSLRWNVRRDWRDGVHSNLFPVKIDPSRIVFRYELEVTRAPREPSAAAAAADGSAHVVHDRPRPPVSPTRAWRLYAQNLRKIPDLPPVLRVGTSIFSSGPLPDACLTLPSEFFDAGWEKCGLRLADHTPLASLSAADLKQVMNKMLPWALSFHSRHDASYVVAKEVDGKMVSTQDSIAVSGLRIFRGTTASMLQIAAPHNGDGASGAGGGTRSGLLLPNNKSSSSSSSSSSSDGGKVPASSVLRSLSPTSVPAAPFAALCSQLVRKFNFQGREICVFQLEDASGTMLLTLWDCAPGSDALAPGAVFEIGGAFKVKPVDPRFRRSDNDHAFELLGTPQTVVRRVVVVVEEEPAEPAPAAETAPASSAAAAAAAAAELVQPTFADTTLALRLDTRCTVASEKSLLDEIRQHFGDAWPYSEEQQKRIARAIQGTPCILSSNLRHTIVRSVRFDYATPEEAPMDPHLRRLAPDLARHQPYAVLSDFSVCAVQLLHCVHDPKLRSWQQISAPACSFFPQDRVRVLERFRHALANGLQQWGVTLMPDALSTRDITVLEKPEGKAPGKIGPGGAKFPQQQQQQQQLQQQQQQQQQRQDRPRLVSICAIRGKHTNQEELAANEKTAVSLARHFATPHHTVVNGEAAALEHVRKTLMTAAAPGSASASAPSSAAETLRDPNSVAIFLTSDRDSRAARWLQSECLRRGILPYFMQGISNEKRLRLLNVQTSQNLQLKFSTNPFPSVDLAAEVPSLAGKNVLMVGVDTCHTNASTVGACVGFVVGGGGASGTNFVVPQFFKNDVRGQELEQVTRHFGVVVEEARRKVPGEVLHEIIVMQDGNVFADLEQMEACCPAGSRLTFCCLHKRTHIRFSHRDAQSGRSANVCKGSIVRALTPVSGVTATDAGADDLASSTPSFFMNAHECHTSTARGVHVVCHRISPTLPLPDLQKLMFALAHVGGVLESAKLPLPTRAAHRISAQIERLVDASPAFSNVVIPEPLRNRCWFL